MLDLFHSWIIVPLLLGLPVGILMSDIYKWWRMPPGPLPLPFIGNLYLPAMRKKQPWLQFEAWSKIYGPIYTIWIGRRPTLIISDPVIAAELLEKRSSKYSSRPRFVVMGEVYWDNASILVQAYGKAWLTRRKALHHAMTPKALHSYRPVQQAEATRLCYRLMNVQRLDDWEKEMDRFTASIVFSVAYGHRIDSLDAKVLRQRFEFMQYVASLNIPGKYLAETFPVLAKLPTWLAPWKRDIQARGRLEAAVNCELVDGVSRELAAAKVNSTEVPQSLTKLLLELREAGDIPLSYRDFCVIPASLFGAGSDTTASTLCSAVLALVTHPEALRAAQAELDTVVGSDRCPTFADEQSLSYVYAMAQEVLRWRPVAVLGGTPHASSVDDIYEGWHIPAGTTVLGNSWAINLNPEYYPDPQRFEPARFLKDGAAAGKATIEIGKSHPSKLGHSSFGWGRRICPGADLAQQSLFVALANIVWAFNIEALEGIEYDTMAYTEGFNIRPKSFACRIRIRSQKHREVLVKEMEGAMRVLEKFTPFD